MPQIEVTFDIDANGIVQVTAKTREQEKETSIKIVASQKLNEEEIEKMKKDAEKHAEEDKKAKEEIETFNTADMTINSTEKMLEELKDKISEEQKTKINSHLTPLKELLAKEDKSASEVQQKMDELNKALQEVGSQVYGAMNQQNNTADSNTSNENQEGEDKEKVVDAEFEEKDKK